MAAMRLVRVGWWALGVAAILAGACSPYTVSQRPDEPLSPSSAYVYGRFELDSRGSRNSMGFVVRCTGAEKDEAFDIGFSSKHPLQIFKVGPGTCAIDEAVYTTGREWTEGQRAAPLAVLRNRELSAGVAYYIGDFLAASTAQRISSSKVRIHWGVTEVRNNYAGTTAEMKRMFPKLAPLATEDAMGHR
jgi:hypothetical protein